MRIYFSGGGGLVDTPEVLIPKLKPHVMLTFHNLKDKQKSAVSRLQVYIKRKKNENK